MKPNVGMVYPVCAPVASYTAGTSISYSAGSVISEARAASVSWDRSDSEFYGDDVLLDTDNGVIIKAQWESGAIDFGADHLRKYSSMLWVGLKPEKGTSVDVCVETDRKNTFREKIISSTKAKVPGQPFTVRSKIKAKKFVFYRLLLSVDEKMPAVTVTNVDFRVRQTGYAK